MGNVLFGVFCVALGVVISFMGNRSEIELATEAKALQAACESSLPRNQQCVMTFVPDDSAEAKAHFKRHGYEIVDPISVEIHEARD